MADGDKDRLQGGDYPWDALAPGGGSPLGPSGIVNRPIRAAIERAKQIADEREHVGDNSLLQPSPSPTPEPPPSAAGQPMHFSDRWLFIVLAWSAIPTAAVVAGMVASFQSYPHWGAGLVISGLLGMAAVTLHLMEKKPKSLPKPSLMVGAVAVITWAFLAWEVWVLFRPAVKMPTADEIAAAVVKAMPKDQAASAGVASDRTVLCMDGPCPPAHVKPGPEYLKEIGLGSGSGQPLILQAAPAATSSERLRVFVDYSEYRDGWMPKTRAFIGEIKEPVKGKIERLPLILQATKENAGTNTLWWGDPSQGNAVTTPAYSSTIPAALVRARLTIIGSRGEQHYYFMLVRAAGGVGTYVGVLPEHDSGDWIESWENE